MDNDKKKRCKKWGNVGFICLIAVFLLAGLVRTVCFPKDINYYENRYSNKVIAPSVGSFADSSFQNSLEDALSDQIPAAQRLKKAYNQTMSFFSNLWVTPLLENNTTTYVNFKNGIKIFGGYYVYDAYTLDSVKSAFQQKAANYNQLFRQYPDIAFYAYYIEKDTDINFETAAGIHADEYLFSLLELDGSHTQTFEIDNFNDFANYYYKTDHHWKHTGSYEAYTEIAALLGCEDGILPKGDEVLIAESYKGSKASTAGSDLITEPFYAYQFEFPAFKQITRGQNTDYGAQESTLAAAPAKSISYGGFYGGDDGEVIFDTGKTELENVLIIGDSFDNAILKLLATHFNRTHSIDLRNHEHDTGSTFNFKEYAHENDIDKVLFIGGIDFYSSNTFELEKK